MKVSGCDLAVLGERMRLAREALGLTQVEFNEKFGYGSVRSYQKNEAGYNEAGICLAGAFIRAGISANWLIAGDGPMLLADLSTTDRVKMVVAQRDELGRRLQDALEKLWLGTPPASPTPVINVDALEAIIEGALKIAPNASANKIAAHSARLYKRCIEDGMITVDGIGNGNQDDAA